MIFVDPLDSETCLDVTSSTLSAAIEASAVDADILEISSRQQAELGET
jgi:hypothetical protein